RRLRVPLRGRADRGEEVPARRDDLAHGVRAGTEVPAVVLPVVGEEEVRRPGGVELERLRVPVGVRLLLDDDEGVLLVREDAGDRLPRLEGDRVHGTAVRARGG